MSLEQKKWTPFRTFVEIVGWIGAIALVYAYYLIQTKRVEYDESIYLWLNIIGALCLMLNTVYHHAYPSAVTNLIWFLIGAYMVIKIWSEKSEHLNYS